MELVNELPIVLATADDDLLDRVLSTTAAAGVDPLVVRDPAMLRAAWPVAGVVLIGADQARQVAAMGLPRRAEVYLLASGAAIADAQRWSLPLGAAVVELPASNEWLMAAVATAAAPAPGPGRTVCVLGGSGGAGASTLAAALAVVAAQQWGSSLLVDLDPLGGGLDLLVGAEESPGWRWPRLVGVRGHLGDLRGHLPHLMGVDLLSMARGAPDGWVLEAEQLRVVLDSAARGRPGIVLDLPRTLDPLLAEAMRPADLMVVVVRGDVRGIAAGRELVTRLAAFGAVPPRIGVVVRPGRSPVFAADRAADAVGADLLGVLPEDPGLARAADRGEPPGRAPRSALARLAADLWPLVHPAEALTGAAP